MYKVKWHFKCGKLSAFDFETSSSLIRKKQHYGRVVLLLYGVVRFAISEFRYDFNKYCARIGMCKVVCVCVCVVKTTTRFVYQVRKPTLAVVT